MWLILKYSKIISKLAKLWFCKCEWIVVVDLVKTEGGFRSKLDFDS